MKGQRQKSNKTPEQRLAEKRQRFLKLAGRRVENALRALRNVERLGSPAGYSYNEAEVEAIREALTAAVKRACAAFFAKDDGKTGFTLPS